LPSIDFAYVLIAFSVLLVSLTVHEAAHAWTADRLGDPTARQLGRVSLNPAVHVDLIGTVLFPLIALMTGVPVIGWAKPVPVDTRNLPKPRRDFMLIAAAGPVSNLVLAVIASALFAFVWGGVSTNEAPTQGLLTAARVLYGIVGLNVMLAVFNMLPIPPLDGGNVLMGLLPPRAAAQFSQIRQYGFLILYALLLTGLFQRIVSPPTSAIVSLLTPMIRGGV
jgi:Zn-dependent protease